jgi:micrococcal nuclease
VTRHTDGDTLRIRIDGVEEKVRLVGIDTPESVKPNSPVECFGKEAAAHLARLVPLGTPVRVVLDAEPRDRYDRLLAYVYRAADGLFVNAAMAADGYANLLTIPPNVAHTDDVRAAVADARSAGRGLWSACVDDHPFT